MAPLHIEEIVVDAAGISELAPRQARQLYLRALLEPAAGISERKTGVVRAVRTLTIRDGGLDLLRRAA